MTDKFRAVTFFGGAVNDRTTKEYLDTIEIGQILSPYFTTLFSGGYSGLMEAVSKAFEGTSVGFTCKTFPSTKGNEYLDHTIAESDIYSRLRSLISNTNIDLFVVQAGGMGTMSELFLLLDGLRKNKVKDKKVILYGKEFWLFLWSMPSHILKDVENNCVVIDSIEELKLFLKNRYDKQK